MLVSGPAQTKDDTRSGFAAFRLSLAVPLHASSYLQTLEDAGSAACLGGIVQKHTDAFRS